MTSLRTTPPAPEQARAFRLPDIPEKHPDDMTSSKQLAKGGNQGRLESWLGHPESTIVSGERYVCATPGAPVRYPDLLVAFDVDPDLYEANNGYVVSFQGKAPNLVLEIASRRTGHIDVGEKVDFYARVGALEYWRFDETGEFHGTRLAGDQLVEGVYRPIVVDELPDGELRGYSAALGLYLCWRQGRLDFYDPNTEDYIPSLESERHRADAERELRLQAEERIRQLEERLRRSGS